MFHSPSHAVRRDSKFIVIAYAIIDLESLRYPQNEGGRGAARTIS